MGFIKMIKFLQEHTNGQQKRWNQFIGEEHGGCDLIFIKGLKGCHLGGGSEHHQKDAQIGFEGSVLRVSIGRIFRFFQEVLIHAQPLRQTTPHTHGGKQNTPCSHFIFSMEKGGCHLDIVATCMSVRDLTFQILKISMHMGCEINMHMRRLHN